MRYHHSGFLRLGLTDRDSYLFWVFDNFPGLAETDCFLFGSEEALDDLR